MGDYNEGKRKCRNACHGHERQGTDKNIEGFERKRPFEKDGPEWQENINFVCLLEAEIASERASLVYSRCFKRRRCYERDNKLQYEKR